MNRCPTMQRQIHVFQSRKSLYDKGKISILQKFARRAHQIQPFKYTVQAWPPQEGEKHLCSHKIMISREDLAPLARPQGVPRDIHVAKQPATGRKRFLDFCTLRGRARLKKANIKHIQPIQRPAHNVNHPAEKKNPRGLNRLS